MRDDVWCFSHVFQILAGIWGNVCKRGLALLFLTPPPPVAEPHQHHHQHFTESSEEEYNEL